VVHVKWITEGKVYMGGLCTAQGIMQQVGDTGSALATLAIALHTFVVVMWGTRPHHYISAYIVVGLTWLFIGLFIAFSVTLNTHGSTFYEMPVGWWCWIGNRYRVEQYLGQCVWVWLTMFVCFLTYTPLFFLARGNIAVSPTHWWKFKLYKDKDVVEDIDPDGRKRRAIGMIAYPLVFAILALPLSVVRWRTGFGASGRQLPTATFVVEFIYSLSGTLNVLLFLFTRSDLLLPQNISSRRNRLGIPPAVTTMAESKTEGTGVVGLLPGADDVGWHLPVSKEGSDMSDIL